MVRTLAWCKSHGDKELVDFVQRQSSQSSTLRDTVQNETAAVVSRIRTKKNAEQSRYIPGTFHEHIYLM